MHDYDDDYDDDDMPQRQKPLMSIATFAHNFAHGRRSHSFTGKFKKRKLKKDEEKPALRILYLSQLIKNCTTQWLSREGGYRDKALAISEDRRKGRIWDSPMWEKLNLRFTSLSLQALVACYQFSSGEKASLKLPYDNDASNGDIVFFHYILDHFLSGVSAFEDYWSKGKSKLKAPLTRLYYPDRLTLSKPQIKQLHSESWAILISYIDREIANSWVSLDEKREKMTCDQSLPYYSNFGTFLKNWTANCKKIERPDLLIPIAEYFSRLMKVRISAKSYIKKTQSRVIDDLKKASEREKFQRTLGAIYKIGEALDKAYEASRGRSYVNRTAADHLYLTGYQNIYQSISEEVKGIARNLSGEIG